MRRRERCGDGESASLALVATVAAAAARPRSSSGRNSRRARSRPRATVGRGCRIDQALTQGDSKVSGVAAQVVEVRTATEAAAKGPRTPSQGRRGRAPRPSEAVNRAEAADMRAGQAMGKAEEAGTMASGHDQGYQRQRLTRCEGPHNRALGDTVVIQFGFDHARAGRQGPDGAPRGGAGPGAEPGGIVDLEGYTDNAGDELQRPAEPAPSRRGPPVPGGQGRGAPPHPVAGAG